MQIVSKVGAAPNPGGKHPLRFAQRPEELRAAVEANLTALGLEQIPVVNLRRADSGPMRELCLAEGIAWVSYFPLGSAAPHLPKVTDAPAVITAAESPGSRRPRSASRGCCTARRTCCSSRAPRPSPTWRRTWRRVMSRST